MGYSRIYSYIAFTVSCIVTIALIIFFIWNGVLLDWSTTAPAGCILLLGFIFFFVFMITWFFTESHLYNKYEYKFEDYKYSIRKDVLQSGEERYYPMVSLAKYSTEQYIKRILIQSTGQIYYELTNFSSNKERAEYSIPKFTEIYYSTEERAKQVIEEYKKYWIFMLENEKKKTEEYQKRKKDNEVKSSEIITEI